MMNAVSILDASGHLNLTWDPESPQDVADAERAVLALQREGFVFWRTEGRGASLAARHMDAAELVRSTSHVAPPSREEVERADAQARAGIVRLPVEPPPPAPPAAAPKPLAPRQQQLLDALTARNLKAEGKIPADVTLAIAAEWGTSTGAVAGTHNNLKTTLRKRAGEASPHPAAEARQVGVGTRAVRGG